MSQLRQLLGLIALTVVAMNEVRVAYVSLCVVPLLVALLAIQLDRQSGEVSRLLVSMGARLLPADDREAFRTEWLDHVATAGERGVAPLTRALTIVLIAVPLLAFGLRVGRRRRRST